MYICEICNKVIDPHTKAIRIPVETRTRHYPNRKKEVRRGRRTKVITIPGGEGTEIVREAVACPNCAAKFRAQSAQSEEAQAAV